MNTFIRDLGSNQRKYADIFGFLANVLRSLPVSYVKLAGVIVEAFKHKGLQVVACLAWGGGGGR